MEIVDLPIGDIEAAYYNPRKDLRPGDLEYDKLQSSINRFDVVEPLVWNRLTGRLVGGHQRLKVLQDRGDQVVTVSVVEMGEEDEKALNLALNKIQGAWDFPMLKEILDDLYTAGYDIRVTGFDERELDKLANMLPSIELDDLHFRDEDEAAPDTIELMVSLPPTAVAEHQEKIGNLLEGLRRLGATIEGWI